MNQPLFQQVVDYYKEEQRINALPWHKRIVARWRFNRRFR